MHRAPGRGRGPARRRQEVIAVLSDIAERCAADPVYRERALVKLDRVIDLTDSAEVRRALVSYRRVLDLRCAVP